MHDPDVTPAARQLISRITALVEKQGRGRGGVILDRRRFQDVGIWTTEITVAAPDGFYAATWTWDQPVPRRSAEVIQAIIDNEIGTPWEDMDESELRDVLSSLEPKRRTPRKCGS